MESKSETTATSGRTEDMPADTAFVGGGVYTVDSVRRWAEAVAVRDGRIVAVGSEDDIKTYIGRRTEVFALRGRMLLPGFQDAHLHIADGGMERSHCDLSGTSHVADEYISTIKAYADSHADEKWIFGGSWAMAAFPGGAPTRDQLDGVVPDRPALFPSRDRHGLWVDSKALELANIDKDTPDPPDGRISETREDIHRELYRQVLWN